MYATTPLLPNPTEIPPRRGLPSGPPFGADEATPPQHPTKHTRPYQVETTLATGRGYRQELRWETIYLCPRHSHWVTEGTGSQPINDQFYPDSGPTACWACAEIAATPGMIDADQVTN